MIWRPAPTCERLLAVPDAVVTVGINNRHLSLALEVATESGPYTSPIQQ